MNSEASHRTLKFGQISMDFFGRQPIQSKLLAVLHGGPALSKQYLRPWTQSLYQSTGAPVVLLDLPNHGDSWSDEGTVLDYPSTAKLLANALNQISSELGEFDIIAHSIGAAVAIESFASLSTKPSTFVAISLPAEFSPSNEFRQAKAERQSRLPAVTDDLSYQKYLTEILDLYFCKRPDTSTVDLLTSHLHWIGNEQFMTRSRSIEHSLAKLAKEEETNFYFVQGSNDIVVPNRNSQRLKAMVPQSTLIEIQSAGHFPMLEQPDALLAAVNSIFE